MAELVRQNNGDENLNRERNDFQHVKTRESVGKVNGAKYTKIVFMWCACVRAQTQKEK
jgi:hypothetical protein